MKSKIFIDKNILEKMYWKEGLSLSQIAKKLGVSKKVVRKRMIEYNIPRRPKKVRIMYLNRDELKRLIEKGYSANEIGRMIGVSGSTINRWLRKYGIPNPRAYQSCRFRKKLSDLERGYIAGLIDGEGTISIIKHKNRFIPLLAIYNTDKKMLEKVKHILDDRGILSIHKYLHGNRSHPLYCLKICRLRELKHILEQIKDVLVTKREHAYLLLEYIDLILKGERNTDKFKQIQQKIRELNMKKHYLHT